METKAISLGRTLAVPFVQELAKKGLTSVPPRYLHHDQDPPIISLDSCSPQVPVIDMQRLLSEDFMDSELQKLDQACREWGFFQLINHEMSSRLVEKFKLETEEFFKLPMEEKSKYGQQEGDVEGYGNVFVVSEDQKLHWGDKLYFTTSPPHLRKPHLFPNLPPSFRDTLEAYSTGLINVAARILGLIGKNLRIDNNEMAFLSEGRQSMSFNYYPPCPQPEQVIGIAPHSDSSGITILLEVNDVQGLQIKKDGMWIPVKPLPNAFIINIGAFSRY
jgi:isopenicillin N synthase-like dioxygenase